MSLIALLVNLLVIVVIVLVVKFLLDQFSIGTPLRNIIYAILALVVLLWIIGGAGHFFHW